MKKKCHTSPACYRSNQTAKYKSAKAVKKDLQSKERWYKFSPEIVKPL